MGLGRDRNVIDDRLLVLGIPAMFAHIKEKNSKDEYKHALARLVTLMNHEGTGLKSMVDFARYSKFNYAQRDREQLTQSLHACFKEHFPSAQPACEKCAKSKDQAEVSCPCDLN